MSNMKNKSRDKGNIIFSNSRILRILLAFVKKGNNNTINYWLSVKIDIWAKYVNLGLPWEIANRRKARFKVVRCDAYFYIAPFGSRTFIRGKTSLWLKEVGFLRSKPTPARYVTSLSLHGVPELVSYA